MRPPPDPTCGYCTGTDDYDVDDEDETCGFCIFMRNGGCRREFNVSPANADVIGIWLAARR